jgi:hypothetical protein
MELLYRGLAYQAYAFALFIPQAKTTCKYRGVAYTKSASLNVAVQPTSILKYRGNTYTKRAFNPDPQSCSYD